VAETKYTSLGKGIISSSIGKLLQARGYNITIQKFDPYINIDPGTLNPYEHGECYVTEDGMETDLDLGHYERFTGIKTTKANSMRALLTRSVVATTWVRLFRLFLILRTKSNVILSFWGRSITMTL